MKSAFLPRLVNGPFGDPGLHIGLRWEGRAVQFDLGRMDRFPAAELVKLGSIFVSHTHMDHFFGFDRLLRLFLSRDAEIDLYGPPGIAANVRGKIAGYTWNLTEGYPLVIRVHEVDEQKIRSLRLPATSSFEPEPLGERPFTGTLEEHETFRIQTRHLDHRIPCLAFALAEEQRLNVMPESLERLGVPPGRWLSELKSAVRRGASEEEEIRAVWREQGTTRERVLTVGHLRTTLLHEAPGQRFAYVVDTLFSRGNAEKICELAAGADVFFCEAPFLDEDRHEAVKRYHLTARQAGTLARMAGVKRLQVFHFSPRYEGRADRLYDEAMAAFRGDLAPDVPVA